MDDFETFKASREKMDPTSRKMTDHQWKQSYAAYQSARERVGGGGSPSSSSAGKPKKRRVSKTGSSARGSHQPSSVSELGNLRYVVRQQSAYADLRLIIDIFAWVAVVIFVLVAVVSMFFYTSMPAAIIALLWAGVQIIAVVVARLLVQVLIDIPDIALHRSVQESTTR